MNTHLLLVFICLNITNVIVQTVKSLATVKCGKEIAALANAVAFGLYTVVTVYMLCDLPLLWKALIVALCNLVGVYCVKWVEEKTRKDKLWKVEATIDPKHLEEAKKMLLHGEIPFNYIDLKKYVVFNAYCETQKQSIVVKEVFDFFDAKYFVSESKTL